MPQDAVLEHENSPAECTKDFFKATLMVFFAIPLFTILECAESYCSGPFFFILGSTSSMCGCHGTPVEDVKIGGNLPVTHERT